MRPAQTLCWPMANFRPPNNSGASKVISYFMESLIFTMSNLSGLPWSKRICPWPTGDTERDHHRVSPSTNYSKHHVLYPKFPPPLPTHHAITFPPHIFSRTITLPKPLSSPKKNFPIRCAHTSLCFVTSAGVFFHGTQILYPNTCLFSFIMFHRYSFNFSDIHRTQPDTLLLR